MSENITSTTSATAANTNTNTNTPTSTTTTTTTTATHSKSNYYNPSLIHHSIYNNNNNNGTAGSTGPIKTIAAATSTSAAPTTNTDSGKTSVSSISASNSIFSEAPEVNSHHYYSHPPHQHFPFMTNNNHHHHSNVNVGGIPTSGYPFPQPNASPTTTIAGTITSHSNGTPESQQQQPLVAPPPQSQPTVSASLPQFQNQIVSGTGASTNPPLNPRISAKFTNNDIQILRQLLLAGEKHKWKQITKELNSSTNHNAHIVAAISAAAIKSRSLVNNYDSNNNINDNTPTTNLHHSFGYHHLQQQQHSLEQKSLGHRVGNGTTGSSSSASSGSISGNSPSTIPAKNVSPTFVVKQYQQLLGLPNNALYFGTLGSSLPYVVAENGWDDIGPEAVNYQF